MNYSCYFFNLSVIFTTLKYFITHCDPDYKTNRIYKQKFNSIFFVFPYRFLAKTYNKTSLLIAFA
jgi:hypothetical protein